MAGFATGRRLALVSVLGSGFLAILNIAAGLRGGSTSAFAVGVEFAGDAFASSIVLLGLALAARPADENHPYGHGRIETVSGLIIGLVLAASGLWICYHALQRVGDTHSPPPFYTVWILIVSAVVKTSLSTLKFRYGRQIRSAALVADAWNDAVDILSSVAALTALLLTLYYPDRFLAADHYGGFAVGLIVIFTGVRISRDATLDLMDTMPDARLIEQIRQVAAGHPAVLDVEKCFARKTGLQYHVDIHLEVDPDLTVRDSHDVAHQVQQLIRDRIEAVADVLVHVEPSGSIDRA